MRLVRFPRQPARVSDDVRAALASLGRGENVVGGLALVGVQPPGWTSAVDAVLIVPHGVLVVLGVDLPDPAMRLTAPLTGRWEADGWPLVHPGAAVNPATEALALAEAVAGLVRAARPGATIGTVIAVGPFVETVEQPPADLAGPVRVIHPTPTSMLAATVSLASAKETFSTAAVRSLVERLAPDAPELTESTLVAEGFTATEEVPAPRPSVAPAPPSAAGPRQGAAVAQPGRGRPVRWQGIAALALLVAIAAAAIVLATTQGGGDPPPRRTPPVVPAGGTDFTQRATAVQQECAAHAEGDLQASLRRTGCVHLRRGSYETEVDGRQIAVSVAAVTFADEQQAQEFLALADTPGSGTITDVATETASWPRPVPAFTDAAYASAVNGSAVHLALSCPVEGPSNPDDTELGKAARAALEIPLPD
ncbi:hypothetical protein [Qaidamihabitans albus]|uniref:hypothetical protein n=1 Tax=Qaidamihabitans albus TaxID=2795733 RepID=UPI0018F174BB|nr:hypothetical protein [Qaidamihabitans albus]